MLLANYGCTGTLTIDSFVLNGVAWDITDLTELWHVVEQTGQDRKLPGDGVIPYRRRETVTRIDLTILVIGSHNASATPYANPITGLATNIGTIMSSVVNPPGTGGGTRAASLTRPGLSTLTTNVHVLGLRKTRMLIDAAQLDAMWEGTLQLSIPVKFA